MQLSEITFDEINDLKELQPEGWPDIIEHFKFYTSTNFCKPIKLLFDEQIVAIGTTIFYGTSAWLAHIIVHKSYRNKGLGTRITKVLLDSIDKNIYKTISLIATPLGEPVYKKLGFQKETSYCFFNNDSASAFEIDNKSIRNSEPFFYDDILKLDKTISGEDRSMLLKYHLQQSKVFYHEDEVYGFYMPTLNEGLIVSKDKGAGLELLKLRLNNKSFSILPQENNYAISFMSQHGFKHSRSASRMSLGAKLNFKGEMLYNRIGGNFG